MRKRSKTSDGHTYQILHVWKERCWLDKRKRSKTSDGHTYQILHVWKERYWQDKREEKIRQGKKRKKRLERLDQAARSDFVRQERIPKKAMKSRRLYGHEKDALTKAIRLRNFETPPLTDVPYLLDQVAKMASKTRMPIFNCAEKVLKSYLETKN